MALAGADMSYLNYYVHKMPWSCTQCHKAFSTEQGAGAHFRAMHRVRTFSCETSSASYVIEVDQNGNYFKDVFVCSICNNTYDGGKHRPRSMPCGHGFCTLCVESSIAQGNRSCPVCRVWHGANSSNKLPVSFLLEELLHMATISTPQKYESDLALENIRVDLLKEKKEAQILTIQKQIQSVMNLEKEIKTLHQNTNDDVNEEICRRQRFEKEVELLLIQIEQSNQEIFKKQKAQEQIQDAIESCPRRIKSMERVIKILSDSTDNQIISQECYLASHEIEVSQEFEETVMKELNLNVDTPCKTANTNSGLQSNDLVMLDSLSPTVDSDDEREDTPRKTAITNSGQQRNDLVILDSLSPTVDSDDEREVVTVGDDEDMNIFLAEVRAPPIINHLKKPWSCALCPKSFSTKEGASNHILNSHHRQTFICEQTIAACLRKRDQIGHYIKDVFECYICKHTYDGGKQRPRALPCGHGFCTLCIESCIAQENKSCPVCRMWHGANSANKLPVSLLLEKLLHKATISTSKKHESDLIPEQVIVNLMKEMKGAQILTVQKQLQIVTHIENNLKALHQTEKDDVNEEICKRRRLEEEVELILAKIEESNQEILRKQKPHQYKQDALQSCQKNKNALERLADKFRAASNNHIITQEECHLAANELTKSQKWEETFRKEFNLDVSQQEKYTKSKRNGLLLCSKVLSEGGKAIIPNANLTKEQKPFISAILIKEDELNLTSATTTTVFLDFTARGINLGRVYVRVLSNRARGKLFVMLALGINGSTLKGANFAYKCSNRIQLMNYFTENNAKSSDLLLPMEYDHYDKVSKGSLYRCASGCFQIWTKNDREVQKGFGYFGYVNAGLEVIDRAASDEFAITDITISESGIVLGY